jgi:peptidoglycan/xylan/chitin deacetylase (PgdA/CDA1 family)
MQNGLSVDVEDWFQVGAFERTIDRADWDGLECRVEANCDAVLQIFADSGARGTFFTLGWVAERYPALIKRIVAAGHELASHGYDHKRVFNMTADEFAADLRQARAILEDLGGGRDPRLSRAQLLGRYAHAMGARGARRAGLCLFVERRAGGARPLRLAAEPAPCVAAAPPTATSSNGR